MRGPHRARRQWDPVDLVFEDGCRAAVLFWTDPNVPVGPEGETAELLDRRVCGGDGVPDGQVGGVEDPDVAA